MRISQYIKIVILILCLSSLTLNLYLVSKESQPEKNHELISLFPIENYDQVISHWIKPSDQDYDQSLLTPEQQKIRKDELYAKYFGERSPWSPEYINQIFSQPEKEDLKSVELKKIEFYDNANKSEDDIQFGSNFIPHSSEWIQQIQENMNLQQFAHQHFDPQHRGITIDNLQGRVLPTNDVSFYSYKIAGQGYPFDNLQAAMVWSGTPVYILGETRDHSWSLVQTPNFIAWVQSNGIAIADDHFVREWQVQAQKDIAAITRTNISIMDSESNSYRFTAYIGMLFPAISNTSGIRIAIPIPDANRHAKILYTQLTHDQAVIIPLLPTPHHFAEIIRELINRPYGWGGMYANNDCSAELKSLFIPFGILLPAHSTNQVDPKSYIVKQVDLSNLSVDERMAYLAKHGHKFMTIVYIGGHVFLYLGNYINPDNPNEKVILTYQEMWGLKPKKSASSLDSRVIIGKSVLFPLLKNYPENTDLVTQANKSYFQLGYLDPEPSEIKQPLSIDLQTAASP